MGKNDGYSFGHVPIEGMLGPRGRGIHQEVRNVCET